MKAVHFVDSSPPYLTIPTRWRTPSRIALIPTKVQRPQKVNISRCLVLGEQIVITKCNKISRVSMVFKYKIDSIFDMMSIHRSDKIFCESNISLLQEHLTHTKKSRCMLAISMLLTPGTFLMFQGVFRDF